MDIRQSYVVKTDAKRRVLLRGKPYPYYRVREFSNGCLLLEPREMVAPQGITAGDLEDLENMAEAFPDCPEGPGAPGGSGEDGAPEAPEDPGSRGGHGAC